MKVCSHDAVLSVLQPFTCKMPVCAYCKTFELEMMGIISHCFPKYWEGSGALAEHLSLNLCFLTQLLTQLRRAFLIWATIEPVHWLLTRMSAF